MADPFIKRKSDEADLKKRYTIYVQVGLVVSLLLLIVLFTTEFKSKQSFEIIEEQQEIVQVEEIVQTRQIEKPPPPPKPPAPIEVPDDAIEDEITLDLDISLDLSDAPPAPPPPPPPPSEPEPEPEPEPEIFEVVEQAPVLIGGLEELQRRVQYPELARRAGVEGTVFIQFVVDEQGNISDLVCVRDPGGGLCEAALTAVRASKFEPGRQRGRPVKVRFSLPVRFRLR